MGRISDKHPEYLHSSLYYEKGQELIWTPNAKPTQAAVHYAHSEIGAKKLQTRNAFLMIVSTVIAQLALFWFTNTVSNKQPQQTIIIRNHYYGCGSGGMPDSTPPTNVKRRPKR